ncbi:alpha/beta hydrolase [Jatrophihabitans sp. DSM 45814]
MIDPIELSIDVTEQAGLGMPAHTTATVFLPDEELLSEPPIVCFAFPGGGYSRRYYSFDMPDSEGGGEAGWHRDRGWIVVTCDHLGFGDATAPEGNVLDFDNVALGNKATVEAVLEKLEQGTLHPGYPAIRNPTKLALGQSMGGCFTIVLQGQHQTFDGIAALGFSGIHTVVPTRPGAPAAVWPWMLRSAGLDNPKILNEAALAAAAGPTLGGQESLGDAASVGEHPFAWSFHYDDEPADIVALDMAASAGTHEGPLPSWRSPGTPTCGILMVAPGAVATEAAAISVPVLVAVGERDVVPNPWMEPFAFKSSTDISVFVCPRMGHMHNFAHTRHLFWERIHSWGTGVAQLRTARQLAAAAEQTS